MSIDCAKDRAKLAAAIGQAEESAVPLAILRAKLSYYTSGIMQ